MTVQGVEMKRSAPTPGGVRQPGWRDFAEARTVDDFYRGWLAVQCRQINGVGAGAVFRVSPDGRPAAAPVAVWGSAALVPPLAGVARRALAHRGRVVSQHGVDTRRRLAVAFPVQAQGRVVATVVLDLAPRPKPELLRALRQLEWGSGWLKALALRHTAARHPSADVERLQLALEVVASAQSHGRFVEAATAFVTALASRLGCDRVSIGFVRGGRARLRAMSHTADLGSRTNLVRAIESAMDEAIDQAGPVAVPAPPGAAPRVQRAHEALAGGGTRGGVCTVPLARGHRIVGALTLERAAGRPFDAAEMDLIEAVAGLTGPGLDVQRREDRWLGAKALDAAAQTLAQLVGPGHTALKLVTAAVLATAAVLVFATGDYRVSARGVMEARVQRAAAAPFGGYVREAPARAGDVVRAGQVLAVLDDRELLLERARLESQRDQLERQRALALAQGNPAQIKIAAAQIDQTVARLALVVDQLGRTRLLAGFDGIVVTGDLSQALGAPVEKGQVLFEIAPLESYRLVVQVDERDIRDVVVGQPGQLRLASTPFVVIPFTVEKIVPVATARDGRNFFRVEAALADASARLRPGMEGVAKIDVDRRRLAAIWTRSAVDWARLTVWTWWP